MFSLFQVTLLSLLIVQDKDSHFLKIWNFNQVSRDWHWPKVPFLMLQAVLGAVELISHDKWGNTPVHLIKYCTLVQTCLGFI